MFTSLSYVPMACAMVFVLGDILSGITKAFASNAVSSSKMREGLWHKSAIILLVATSLVCAAACIAWPELPAELSAVYPAVCLYVCLMELVSILENICEINPELKMSKIFEIFNIKK